MKAQIGSISNAKLKSEAVREAKGSVLEQLFMVEDRVNEVVMKLDELEVHISPVLSSASPDCQKNEPAPDATCELDNRLQMVKIQLENIFNRLADLNIRVQL